MSEKNFDYIGAVREVLKSNNLLAEAIDQEHRSIFETGTTKVKKFRNSFKMSINDEGWFITYCPMAGKIPERIMTEFMTEMLSQTDKLASLKLYVDTSGMLMASYETLLPDDPEILESEVFNSMTVLDMAYASCMPRLMQLYWSAMEEDDENN